MSNRRSSFSSSTTSSLAKRHASAAPSSLTENHNAAGKPTSLAKKRAPLTNLTNHIPRRSSLVPCATKVAKTKKDASSCSTATISSSISNNKVPPVLQSVVKANAVVLPKPGYVSGREEDDAKKVVTAHVSKMDISPCKSDGASVSMSVDESMSSCDSFKSPVIEYLDNNDISPAVESIERKTFSTLNISDTPEPPAGNICSRDILVGLEKEDKVVNVDNNYMDPQLCATFACDIYKHLRASEAKKRPSTDFMESVQKDINPSMRAILIDWLVEVAEEYRLVPDTLYLTVNYIDRYLSGNPMNRQKLQLLGVASMMVASKYEEICAPQVEEFCYITDNTYFKEEVLQMESAVLNYLKFEMTAPTIKCFLR
ncbi:Cyclin-A1-1, variant 3 [Stylosanthes scabra]|nr:Cyclin-A1-1, variant 3 [Stylosanthes scabra]